MLRFGEFKTKAGRLSPYFFNAGLFDDGAKLAPPCRILCTAPAASCALEGRIQFDMIFGPAYKGITLAAAVAMELARLRVAMCLMPTTEKKPKITVKAARLSARRWRGRVLIIDDVISAGTSVRESISMIAGGRRHTLCGGDCDSTARRKASP